MEPTEAREIRIEGWKREKHFRFFQTFEDPFFNISCNVKITGMHRHTRNSADSLFLAILWTAGESANQIPEFRTRFIDDKVWLFDRIHTGSTFLRSDDTFGFCYFQHFPEFSDFQVDARQRLAEAQSGIDFDPKDARHDLLHCSTLPWISFTGLKHPRRFHRQDSVPKLVFGKVFDKEGESFLPLSVEAHHGLLDGLHIATFVRYFERFADVFPPS